jgi:hypothetical protein
MSYPIETGQNLRQHREFLPNISDLLFRIGILSIDLISSQERPACQFN